MVHGKNSIPYRIDRRLIGLAGPDYDATISSAEGPLTMPLGTFPRGLNVPPPAKDSTPVDYAEALGETYLSFTQTGVTDSYYDWQVERRMDALARTQGVAILCRSATRTE